MNLVLLPRLASHSLLYIFVCAINILRKFSLLKHHLHLPPPRLTIQPPLHSATPTFSHPYIQPPPEPPLLQPNFPSDCLPKYYAKTIGFCFVANPNSPFSSGFKRGRELRRTSYAGETVTAPEVTAAAMIYFFPCHMSFDIILF